MKNSEIPNLPKIEYNFNILELSDKISIKLENDSINKLISKDILSAYVIEMKYNERTVKSYIKVRKYPLNFLIFLTKYYTSKKISNIIKSNNSTYLCKWKEIHLPEFITPRLAYFVGYLQGDGSIQSNQKRIDFTDEYQAQIEKINSLCLELFNTSGKVFAKRTKLSLKPFYRLELGSVVLNSYLHKVFKIKRGIKTKLNIPELFFINKEILRWYIVGLFDADGTLPKNPEKVKQLFVDVTFKDRDFVEQLKKALDSFGVRTLPIYCRIAKFRGTNTISKTYELRIRKREDIIIFLNRIGFFHPDKRIREEKILKMHL
jgi:hypothetical protein